MSDQFHAIRPGQTALKVLALVLAIATIGLPVNTFASYAMLTAMTVVIFSGMVRTQGRAWIAAAAIVAVAIAGQHLLAPPRIDEGHNVFLPDDPAETLRRGLPADVYRHLASEFDKAYPPESRCAPAADGCWRNGGFPDRPFAFSADSIFHPSDMSRAVTAIDFSDPVWLRLGFVNDNRYNWYTKAPDVRRADRNREFWKSFNRWSITMPWFAMFRLPADFAGGELCWRGDVLWEGGGESFSVLRGDGCRKIEPADAGRRIVGVAIKPDSLAMRLSPPWTVWLQQMAGGLLKPAAAIALLAALVRLNPAGLIVPAGLIGLSALAIAVSDAGFFGGLRPMEGGDDGLFYDGVGRIILQNFLAGDIAAALEGGEKVFYYGGPGLRYFRAIEHVIFGETYLGYLSLVLMLPFIVLMLFRRFLPVQWALALTFVFIAIPVGKLFGTAFIDYSKWAIRGYADPAAYILFLAGLLVLCGHATREPDNRFAPAFFGALLLALGIAMKPIVAPAAAVFLGGAGLAALAMRQWPRLAGMCIGFLPVFSMALHNWVYGDVFVLFSSNAAHPLVLVMPPSAYAAALQELITLNFNGGNFQRALLQIPNWLSGPAESYFTVPLNAAGVAILVYVVVRGRRFDPWLRLLGGAALAQHAVALFYVSTARYHFLTWFLTMLVVMVFVNKIGIDWVRRRYPDVSERFLLHPWSRRLASGLSRLKKVSA